ncbi:peptide ABC transporter substrate-binding protein [[Phormidium] sp. ETS-05]|uniref:peptide ABC transporter substrate-binding protein n=1 Tax=[Phormidium] sp. ETS-05 TaxID=222819 RepID=UPI0018EF2C44|nr:peptide ABC transporter substrate-binding protein [[Phormidium] sp. ETS-05]
MTKEETVRKRSKSILPLIIVPIVSWLSACAPQSLTPPTTGQTGQTSQTGQKELRLLYWQAPTILNPHLSNGYKDFEAARITLEPLASFDKNGEMVLFLAAEKPTLENGGLAADATSVTWKLKQGVKWSDRKPFTAADVVFTYEFVTNKEVAANSVGVYENIAKVEAVDDYTVKITFKAPNPAWFLPFTGAEGMILPRHQFEAYQGAKAREAPGNLMPVGTGPYRVVEFKPGDTVVYERNPEFREAAGLGFDRLLLKGGGDSTSAARSVLQTGEADYAFNLQVEPQVLQQMQTGGKGKIITSFGPLVERIDINHSDPNQATPDGERSSIKFPHPFLTDKKVRQALNFAIDRQTIVSQLYGDTGKPTANFLVAPAAYNSPNTSYEFNPQKAAALLDEAGWKDTNGNGIRDKNGVEMKLVFQTSVNPVRQKTQQIIKQSLKTIGIEVELKTIDASIFFSSDPANPDTIARFSADLEMYATGNNNPEPGDYMKTYTCQEIAQKSNNWSGQNFARYCNPAYDTLWQQSQTELDPKKRQQLFIQMNDMLVKDVEVIPLVNRADALALNNSIVGLDLTPWDRNTWNIKDWQRQN